VVHVIRLYFNSLPFESINASIFSVDLIEYLRRINVSGIRRVRITHPQDYLSTIAEVELESAIQTEVVLNMVTRQQISILYNNVTFYASEVPHMVVEDEIVSFSADYSTSGDSDSKWWSNPWYVVPAGCIMLALLTAFAVTFRQSPRKSEESEASLPKEITLHTLPGSPCADAITKAHIANTPSEFDRAIEELMDASCNRSQIYDEECISTASASGSLQNHAQEISAVDKDILEESYIFPKRNIPLGSFRLKSQPILNARRQLEVFFDANEDATSAKTRTLETDL